MKDSIFNRIYSYRQRENKNSKENYLIEILGYCLEYDNLFRNDFIKNLFGIHCNDKDIEITTQSSYENYGRPDIELNFYETTILIECKIDSTERENQLQDYADILDKERPTIKNKYLLYLTKYYEVKEIKNKTVNLILCRWNEIFQIINSNHSIITNQLKQYLKEEQMEKIKNFSIQDLTGLKTISATISKMDELLDQFKDEFGKKFGGYSKDSSRSSYLKDNGYYNYVYLKYEKKIYSLEIGFHWDIEEYEIPYLCVSIYLPKRKFENSDLKNILTNELGKRKWEIEDDYIYTYKSLIEFFNQPDKDQIPAMKDYLNKKLQDIYYIKEKYPKTFRQ